jgi:hypothetical protein
LKPNIKDSEFVFELNQFFIQNISHGFAQYSFSENYALYIFCLLTDHKHRGIVIPEHLQLQNKGICSQQSLLFMYICQKREINTRAVRLNKHFVSEVFFDGKWHMIDTDLNLVFTINETSKNVKELANNQFLKEKFYLSKIDYPDKALANTFFSHVEYLPTNDFPAKNLKLLHQISLLVSEFLWILLWLIYFIYYKFKKKNELGIHQVPFSESIV